MQTDILLRGFEQSHHLLLTEPDGFILQTHFQLNSVIGLI